jgi:Cytochrome oxidase complex assembly protein 1
MNMSPQSSWWSRNWKWFVPISCLTLLLFIVMTAGIYWLLFRMLQSSGAYLQAVARAEQSPVIIAVLGEPIREGPFVTGNIRTQNVSGNASGNASLAIPLSGPKGNGVLYVEANKSGDAWTLKQLNFENDQNHQRTDLLSDKDKPGNGSF